MSRAGSPEIQFLLFALCAPDTGFRRYDRVSAVAPLRVEILKLLAKRRGEHARHVLIEPLLELRAEHLLDAVFERFRRHGSGEIVRLVIGASIDPRRVELELVPRCGSAPGEFIAAPRRRFGRWLCL